jgi:hypothetical protein
MGERKFFPAVPQDGHRFCPAGGVQPRPDSFGLHVDAANRHTVVSFTRDWQNAQMHAGIGTALFRAEVSGPSFSSGYVKPVMVAFAQRFQKNRILG